MAKYKAGGKSFASIEAAKVYAEAVFAKSGVVIGIEEVAKKLSKKELEAERNKRFSRALAGFVVPMMSIPAMGKQMDAAVAVGASDEELKAIVASFPGVKESV